MKQARFLAFAVMAASSPLATAQDTGWYIGGNVGKSYARIDDERINNSLIGAGFTTTSILDDDRDTGYKVFGGYQVNRNFAIESGYFDLGEFGYTATTLPAGTVSGRLQASGFNLDMVAVLGLDDKFSVFGRVGANYTKTEVEFVDTGLAHVLDPKRDKSAVNVKYGLGLQYAMTQSLALRIEVERYRIDDAVGHSGDVDLASVGLVYRFGQTAPKSTKTAYKRPEKAESPMPVVVVVPVPEPVEYCTILNAEFTINESGVQLVDAEKLRVVGTFMKKYPNTTAVIGGHSDNVGRSDDNMKLSQDRAQSVVDYIAQNYNINRSRMLATGFGDTQPVASNSTAQGQRANRRVSAVIACATDIEGLTPVAARLTMALRMDFDVDETRVKREYHDELGAIAKYLNNHPEVSATIQGHASNRNRISREGSLNLSRQRAENVASYLVSNFGIKRARLTTQGFGEKDRFAYNTSAEGKQDNQRVNVIFTYAR